MSIPITGTIQLPHCWVCGGTVGRNEHHIVPQSCGGTHGPTVTLCAAHHTEIHTEAYHPPDKRKFVGPPSHVTKLAYLTDVIYRSFNAVRGQDKPVLKSFKFSVQHQRMWAAWRAAHPGISNDQVAMERALELLFDHVNPLRKQS
jgi:hypothetical protein